MYSIVEGDVRLFSHKVSGSTIVFNFTPMSEGADSVCAQLAAHAKTEDAVEQAEVILLGDGTEDAPDRSLDQTGELISQWLDDLGYEDGAWGASLIDATYVKSGKSEIYVLSVGVADPDASFAEGGSGDWN